MQKIIALVLLCLTAACARTTSTSGTGAGERLGDPALYALLAQVPMTPETQQALLRYEEAHPRDFLEQVALVAEDPRAGTEARYNAVMLLGEHRQARYLYALRAAATDPDPRVRAAVVVAAAMISERGHEGRDLVEAGLQDRSPEVQAKALEVLGPSNLELLRSLVQREPQGEVAAIARTMIRVAEERGAPLGGDSAGVLRRAVEEGITLEFRPVARWPQWQAAVGPVTVKPSAGPAFTLDSVEVVRGIVPVFFSGDARHAVYEHDRSIFVRNLETGAVRNLGPGLAPRPRPFANDFVFMREVEESRTDVRDRTRIRYDVMLAPFDVQSNALMEIGTVGAFTQMSQSGNYSPVRWMRVVEADARFTLEAEGLETFRLPDPFKSGAEK